MIIKDVTQFIDDLDTLRYVLRCHITGATCMSEIDYADIYGIDDDVCYCPTCLTALEVGDIIDALKQSTGKTPDEIVCAKISIIDDLLDFADGDRHRNSLGVLDLTCESDSHDCFACRAWNRVLHVSDMFNELETAK